MKLNLTLIIGLGIFLQFSCKNNSQKNAITKKDTIQVLTLIFNNKKLYSELTPFFDSQHLRIVDNIFLKRKYYFDLNGKAVQYVNIDSSKSNLSNWKKPKYYVNILNFKLLNENKFIGVFQYKSIGVLAEFLVEKKEKKWEIIKLETSQF